MTSDLECPFCGGAINNLSCSECGHKFPQILGSPFIGAYQSEDILGLIEIAANVPNRKSVGLAPETVEEIEGLCYGYYTSTDKVAFLASVQDRHGPYFLNRYAEWEEVHELTADIDLNGKAVLDVGAGVGYDSHRLASKGANVTAIEFSPILQEVGAANFPKIRWVGGMAHALPFADESFDMVFFNAALHHMRNLPTVIFEALRVLRPGGTLITTCDSFRPDNTSISQELQIFDADEAVLLGVNEQVPRFRDFTDTLILHSDCVRVDLYTHTLYGGIDGNGPNATQLLKWGLQDADRLRQRSGSLAMRVKKLKTVPGSRGKIKGYALQPDHFASLLTDQALAISSLADFIPKEYVNRKLSAPHTKFDLLNGWRMPREKEVHRRAFKRARWFFRRLLSKSVTFDVRSVHPASFIVVLNGKPASRFEANADWRRVSVNIGEVPARKTFALEIQRETPASTFEEGHFEVSRLSMSNPLDRFIV
ncbi:class I SAM-dependent methyltransferase [Rhizobium sp. 768_B6_N1_8]|uniref:class I SAM-dependent methyltransferase n=1 Tax=unclassified Rhizobium TaxID=2613769 RepID=UPI003F258124